MSEMLDQQQLDEAAEVLGQFKTQVSQQIEEMGAAAQTCQSEMEDDPVASGAAGELQQALAKISEQLQSVDTLIAQLHEENAEAGTISTWN